MLTALSFSDFCHDLGLHESDAELPIPLIAEYIRASTVQLYQGEPLSTQRLTGDVEIRLRPLGYTKSAAADEYFGETDTEACSLVSVLHLLAEIGDLVRLSGAGHYPAESRFVQLDEELFLVASALPTTALSKQAGVNFPFPSLARLTSERPQQVPEQTLLSWLRTETLDFKQFASEKMAKEGAPFQINAQEWQVYDSFRARGNWRTPRECSVTRGIFLCRFQPLGVMTFQRGIGHIKRNGDKIVCTHFSELSFEDAGRVAHGLHLLSGTFQNLVCRADSEWIEVNISTYESTEILTFLIALSAGVRSLPNKRKKLWFSTKLQRPLTRFLERFGINLICRS